MRKKVIVTLAIGDSFFTMALACINSAKKFYQKNCEFSIFYANIKNRKILKKIRGINLVDIEAIMYSRRTAEELINLPFLYREFKCIPFTYKEYLNYDLLYLDADSIVFYNKFDEIFNYISEYSILIFGSFQNDDYYQIQIKDYKLNLRIHAAKLGYKNVKNMCLNSGFVGRAGDATGKRFGKILDRLIIKRQIDFPPNYYNDELYFMLAFQLSLQNIRNGGKTLPSGIVCTTHGADIKVNRGKHDVYKRISGEGLIRNPAIVHYVGKTNSKEYKNILRKNLTYDYQLSIAVFKVFAAFKKIATKCLKVLKNKTDSQYHL